MTAKAKAAELVLRFAKQADWHKWLAKNHAQSDAVLVCIAKTEAAKAITYAEALDVALAWGWIDSQKRALDADAWLQRFSRRKAKSPWSKINCTKAEALIAAGKMQPQGQTEIDAAKKDGRWERAYDGARTSEVPPDLAAAFARNARARAFFDKIDGANRYAILYRVQTAKKADTRAERIKRFVDMCARHETIHEISKPKAAAKKTRKAP